MRRGFPTCASHSIATASPVSFPREWLDNHVVRSGKAGMRVAPRRL
jgi:hypothetical protein